MNQRSSTFVTAGGNKSQMLGNPMVSICIPAYNCGPYIRKTLDCLCMQNYRNIEIVVVNDGSTDDTAIHVSNFADARVSLVNVTNGGAARARNIAYGHSHGDYVIFFDGDDYVQPDFIARQVEKMNGREDAVAIAAWGRFYQDDLDTFRMESMPSGEMSLEDWIGQYWYHCNPMTNPGRVIIPKQLIEKSGLWNEKLSLNDDLEFYTRLFLHAERIIPNQDAVFFYRSGISGLSAKKGVAAMRSLFDSVMLSTDLVLSRYQQKEIVRQSCANLLQGLVYELYPEEKAMVREAELKIKTLGGSSLPFRSGGYTKLLNSVVGWKATKLIKKMTIKSSNQKYK